MNLMVDICKKCNKEFTHKCHAHRAYCSLNCQKSGDWMKSMKKLHVGQSSWNKGKSNTWTKPGFILSEETKRKISIAKRGQPSPMKGKPFPQLRGEKNGNWNGGTGTERHQAMGKIEYVLWRTSIFMRDDYTCQQCLVRGGELNADHIKPWALYPELRYAIDNGRTLCVSCHRQTDTWGARTNFGRKVLG